MMFSKEVEEVLARLIALANACNLDLSFTLVNQDMRQALQFIRDNKALDEINQKLIEDKNLVVPNCQYCANPCGRTSEVYLNQRKEEKREKAFQLIQKIDEKTDQEMHTILCECSFTIE